MNRWREQADELMSHMLDQLRLSTDPKTPWTPATCDVVRTVTLRVIETLTPLVLDGSSFQSLQKQVLAAVTEKGQEHE